MMTSLAASNRFPVSKVRPRRIGMPIALKYFGSAQRPIAERPLPWGKGRMFHDAEGPIHPPALPGDSRHKGCRIHAGQRAHTLEQRVEEVGGLRGRPIT